MSKPLKTFLKIILGIFIFLFILLSISLLSLQIYIDSKVKNFPDITKINPATLNLNPKYAQEYDHFNYEVFPQDFIEKLLKKVGPQFWEPVNTLKPNISMFLSRGVISYLISRYLDKDYSSDGAPLEYTIAGDILR